MSLISRRLLRAAGPLPRSTPALIRFSSSTGAASSHPAAQPADGEASALTTAPSLKELETASSAKEVITAEVVSGAPVELQHRAVRIYKATRNTMQSGGSKTEGWRIDFDTLQGGGRWENPLMGWASSADYNQGVRMPFTTKEDAIHFAEKQGWNYYVQTPTIKRIPPKNYAENYLYSPGKIKLAHTK